MSSRLEAVEALAADAENREKRPLWKAIFDDPDLEPPTQSKPFEDMMYKFLLREMKNGVARQDALRKQGGSARLRGNQMHITPTIGRYIFAIFSWHNIDDFPDKSEKLKSMAAVFKFRIDPKEIELQKLSEEHRLKAMAAQFEENDKQEGRAFFWSSVSLLIAVFGAVIYKLIRMAS